MGYFSNCRRNCGCAFNPFINTLIRSLNHFNIPLPTARAAITARAVLGGYAKQHGKLFRINLLHSSPKNGTIYLYRMSMGGTFSWLDIVCCW
jgi:hypothetical protein